jgi:hypothetical protein
MYRINYSLSRKTIGEVGFAGQVYQAHRVKYYEFYTNSFRTWRNKHSQTHFMTQNLSQEQTISKE